MFHGVYEPIGQQTDIAFVVWWMCMMVAAEQTIPCLMIGQPQL